MKQNKGETLQQYYIRLKEQSGRSWTMSMGRYNFHNVDKSIKQQRELSTINNRLRKFSFRNPVKILQELLTGGNTLEDNEVQTKQLEQTKLETQEVNTVKRNYQNSGKNILYFDHPLVIILKSNVSFFSSFFFFFSICLDVPHLTNEHRTQDCIAS